jgi:sugar phosphate isomerase/epimerase
MPGEIRFSISELTTFNMRFEDELALLRATPGIEGIGLFESKLPPNARQLLRESGLSAVYCSPTVFTILPLVQTDVPIKTGPDDPEERIAEMCASVRRLAELEPEVVYFCSGPFGNLDESDARRIVREGTAAVADAGAAAGVRIGIEPVHPSQSFASFTHTIPATLEAVGDADVGLLIDTWHVADLDDIRTHIDRVVGVHLADHREPNRSHFDRVMPGDGVHDVPAILRVLDDGGYDGWYEVEVLSDDGTFGEHFPDSLWDLEPAQLVHRARESFDRVWAARLEAVV